MVWSFQFKGQKQCDLFSKRKRKIGSYYGQKLGCDLGDDIVYEKI